MDERRQHQRHKVAMAVGMKGDWVAVISATMEDISQGGAFIKTSRPLKVGSTLDLLVLREDGPPLSLPATVRRIVNDGIGVAWGPLDEAGQTFLRSVLGG
jgi:hypothetical protein